MQGVFSLTLLVLSALYTWMGYSTLEIMSAGMPGPGYFPLLTGLGLVALTFWTLLKDVRRQRGSTKGPAPDTHLRHRRDVALLVVLFAAYIFMLPYLGMLLSTGVFMFLVLQGINGSARGKNLVYAVLAPAGVYLLFEVFLKTGLPTGTFWA